MKAVSLPMIASKRFSLKKYRGGECIAANLSLDDAKAQARTWNSGHASDQWVKIDPSPTKE